VSRILLYVAFAISSVACLSTSPSGYESAPTELFSAEERAQLHEPAEANWRDARKYFWRAQERLNEMLLSLQLTSLDAVVWGDIKLTSRQKDEMARIAAYGVELAEAAVEKEPESAEAHLYLAATTSLRAISTSRFRALVGGLGGDIKKSIRRSLELDRYADAAGALTLEGKFRAVAPWPHRDREMAEKALLEAARNASSVQVYLLLGDTYHLQERFDEAVEAWRYAETHPTPAPTETLDEQLRALARQRLEWVDQGLSE
jgi:tetratricopeptide (TPR) repeat protein